LRHDPDITPATFHPKLALTPLPSARKLPPHFAESAGAIGSEGEILPLDMGDPVRVVDLAVDMIRLSGLEVGEDTDIQVIGLRPGESCLTNCTQMAKSTFPRATRNR